MAIPVEIHEAFTKLANEGELFYVWVFDPHSGEVEVHDHSEHELDNPTHDDMANKYPHPDRIHGHAHRIIHGWRITDWEHKPIKDKFVLKAVHKALKGGHKKKSYSEGYGKWAWVEGLPLEEWEDTEQSQFGDGGGMIEMQMHEKGMNTQQIDEAYENGTAGDYGTVGHFEKLVSLGYEWARKNGHEELGDKFADKLDLKFNEMKYGDIVQLLDSAGVKWAIGVDTSQDGEIEVGAKGPTTTFADIQAAIPGAHIADDYHSEEDAYGLGQAWTFSRFLPYKNQDDS